jgi:hypothetical protein
MPVFLVVVFVVACVVAMIGLAVGLAKLQDLKSADGGPSTGLVRSMNYSSYATMSSSSASSSSDGDLPIAQLVVNADDANPVDDDDDDTVVAAAADFNDDDDDDSARGDAFDPVLQQVAFSTFISAVSSTNDRCECT